MAYHGSNFVVTFLPSFTEFYLVLASNDDGLVSWLLIGRPRLAVAWLENPAIEMVSEEERISISSIQLVFTGFYWVFSGYTGLKLLLPTCLDGFHLVDPILIGLPLFSTGSCSNSSKNKHDS